MIGQKNLVAKLKSYSVATLPHSILLVGEKGCGKHTAVQMLSEHLHLDVVDITEEISLETIENIYISSTAHIYLINMNMTNEKQQNIILKFLEEPSKNAYIILIATSKAILLDTVINRCVSFEFEPYSRDELIQFLDFDADVEKLLYYCHTPGQILKTSTKSLDALIDLCDNIITNLRRARYTNIFKISEKFNYKDDVEKFDVDLFYRVLLERIFLRYVDNHDKSLYMMYESVNNSLKKLMDLRYNKECLVESLLSELWKVCRSE